MTSRTQTKTIHFERVFTLSGIEGEHPAGNYEVEIDEELLPGLSFPVYRRIEVRITLPFITMGVSGYQTVPVRLEELEAALARDHDALIDKLSNSRVALEIPRNKLARLSLRNANRLRQTKCRLPIHDPKVHRLRR